MIRQFDLRDVQLRDERLSVRSAHKADEAILLRWFDPEDAIDRCELRVVEEFTIWPFIIVSNGEEAGFAQAWITTSGTAGIEIFVAPQFRRRGIGSATSALLARSLRGKAGWKRITIEPHTDDEAAIRCYTKAGFVDRGARRDDGDHAHIILEWP